MILKIKKDDFNWLYVETAKFSIHQTYDKDVIPQSFCDGFGYVEAKDYPLIKIVNVPEKIEEKNGKEISPLITYIETDKCSIEYIGYAFIGFVLNDKGQTVERL